MRARAKNRWAQRFATTGALVLVNKQACRMRMLDNYQSKVRLARAENRASLRTHGHDVDFHQRAAATRGENHFQCGACRLVGLVFGAKD